MSTCGGIGVDGTINDSSRIRITSRAGLEETFITFTTSITAGIVGLAASQCYLRDTAEFSVGIFGGEITRGTGIAALTLFLTIGGSVRKTVAAGTVKVFETSDTTVSS